MSICEGCEHKAINNDPELHCYMFREPPIDWCSQHTAFKAIRQNIGKLFLEVFTDTPKL